MKRISVCVITLLLIVAFLALTCPIDNSYLYFTGKVQTDKISGKLLGEYRCPYGHIFWTVYQ